MSIDPVCGMTVDPATAAGHVEHEGTTYHFCSQHCVHAFKADPGRFLQKDSAQKPEPPESPGAQYTCPMHPQIVRDAPGSCPLCGMALVPIAGSGEADDSELRDLTRRFWISAALTAPLAFIAMAPMLGLAVHFRYSHYVEFLLATPVVLWAGRPILEKFWLSLAHWSLTM